MASGFSRKINAGGQLPPDRLRQGYGESAEALRAKAEGGSYERINLQALQAEARTALIFTLNRSHFSIYRAGRRRRFSIVPV